MSRRVRGLSDGPVGFDVTTLRRRYDVPDKAEERSRAEREKIIISEQGGGLPHGGRRLCAPRARVALPVVRARTRPAAAVAIGGKRTPPVCPPNGGSPTIFRPEHACRRLFVAIMRSRASDAHATKRARASVVRRRARNYNEIRDYRRNVVKRKWKNTPGNFA